MVDRVDRPSVDEALRAIHANLVPLAIMDVPTIDALGWPIAVPAIAAIDMPRFDVSAMDGYAVRSADTVAAPHSLPLGRAVPAGTFPDRLRTRTAVPIATGAPIPAGADAVVIRERACVIDRDDGPHLLIDKPVVAGVNVRAKGEDAACGNEVAETGHVVTPDVVGALLSYGIGRVQIRRPRIGLISTGSELVTAAADLRNPASIIDSNAPMIEACCRQLQIPATLYGLAEDDPVALDVMLDRLLAPDGGDILVSTGGVSIGTLDLVAAHLERRGAKRVFHGVRMRPGKPILFAVLPDGRPYFGLPGNPVAALVGFRFFVMAAVRRLAGLSPEIGFAATSNAVPKEGTTLFLRGAMKQTIMGLFVNTNYDQRSHVQRSVLSSDTWLRLDGDGRSLAYPKIASTAPEGDSAFASPRRSGLLMAE